MYSLTILAISSFILALLFTPLVRNMARRFRLVDQPDFGRKVHATPIPRIGGVAIAISYVLSCSLLLILNTAGAGIFRDELPRVLALLPAAIVIFATGLWDDLRSLHPWQKILGQLVAAFLAFHAGVQIHFPYTSDWWNFPVTVLWLLLCTNAVNLIDGVDGLAAGVGLFAASTSLFAGLLTGNAALAMVTVPLAGALLGFLRFNFNPATIFLGDSGSLLIGFLLGCFGVFWSQKSATILGMTAPLMALSIPLLDTLLAIARRFLRQQPIFTADRGHIHHRLLDRGLTPRKVALVLYGCCALGAMASLATLHDSLSGLAIIVFCVMTWIGVQHLGYVEFGTARRMFLEGAFRRALNSQIALKTFEDQLHQAVSLEESWALIHSAARDFGFQHVSLRMNGHLFSYSDTVDQLNHWHIRIPISGRDFVELSRPFGPKCHDSLISPFADAIRYTLGAKFPTQQPEPAQALAAQTGD
ncbi:MAG: undecaprenyl/decaprenyl-phosphate alpha-N-acetylglucosaminyl 1-phosphate transferase [Bryobacterales bacterium]|nr:undecaprenyl/decaprenyl-phosphate alpha-N-acetylglucosaminyl 1-phosphate transferase [Bryobacterales bacterium]